LIPDDTGQRAGGGDERFGPFDIYVFNMHSIAFDIEFDPAKAQANWRKHRVSFVHAEQVLRDAHAITIADPDAMHEPRFVTLGMDALGRLLIFIHTPRADRIRIISARKASPGEAETYHAQAL
jgi:uncharacterized DUF497 family protein